MARHAADFKTYEDYVELCQRYREAKLPEMLAWAEKQKARCLREKRFRTK